MDRTEARRRIDAASSILLDHGWTNRDIENMIDGLHREDMVERIEEAAKSALCL